MSHLTDVPVWLFAVLLVWLAGAGWEIATLDGQAGPVGVFAACVFYVALAVVCLDGTAVLVRAAARRIP